MQVKNDFFIIGFSADFDLTKIGGGKVIKSAEHYWLKLKNCENGNVFNFPCSKEKFEKYKNAETISIELIIAD